MATMLMADEKVKRSSSDGTTRPRKGTQTDRRTVRRSERNEWRKNVREFSN